MGANLTAPALGLVFVLLSAGAGLIHAEQAPQKLTFGIGDKAISPLMINRVIPEYLGYYRQEGISVEFVPAGSNRAIVAGMAVGRFQFGPGIPSLQLPYLARGERFPAVDFFEVVYPGKFAIAVGSKSAITGMSQLKGAKIGVNSFGGAGYAIGQEMVRRCGLDPQQDVSWIAVGEGVGAGIALNRGEIAALDYYDTGFGQIESAGIPLRYLPQPTNFPKVGNDYLMTTPGMLREHRGWVVGVGRGVLKAEVFIRTNPEAAAWIYLQMYPEAAPKGMSAPEQVKAVMEPLGRRMKLFAPHDPSMKWGTMNASDWQDEIDIAGLSGNLKDASSLYTNDLIDEINSFDWDRIKAEARAFRIPYKADQGYGNDH